jgi:hypothetical protein
MGPETSWTYARADHAAFASTNSPRIFRLCFVPADMPISLLRRTSWVGVEPIFDRAFGYLWVFVYSEMSSFSTSRRRCRPCESIDLVVATVAGDAVLVHSGVRRCKRHVPTLSQNPLALSRRLRIGNERGGIAMAMLVETMTCSAAWDVVELVAIFLFAYFFVDVIMFVK